MFVYTCGSSVLINSHTSFGLLLTGESRNLAVNIPQTGHRTWRWTRTSKGLQRWITEVHPRVGTDKWWLRKS